MGRKKSKKYSSYKVVSEGATTKMPVPPASQKKSNDQDKPGN